MREGGGSKRPCMSAMMRVYLFFVALSRDVWNVAPCIYVPFSSAYCTLQLLCTQVEEGDS